MVLHKFLDVFRAICSTTIPAFVPKRAGVMYVHELLEYGSGRLVSWTTIVDTLCVQAILQKS